MNNECENTEYDSFLKSLSESWFLLLYLAATAGITGKTMQKMKEENEKVKEYADWCPARKTECGTGTTYHNLKAEGSTRNSTSINDIFTKRQTDRETAEALKKNILGLVERGLTPSIMDIRYVKLAEYENCEEELKSLYSWRYDDVEENDENYE
jgi:hypothetical protein